MSSEHSFCVDSMVRIPAEYFSSRKETLDVFKSWYTLINKNTEEELELWDYDEDRKFYSFPRKVMNYLSGIPFEDKRSRGLPMKFSAGDSIFSPREGQDVSISKVLDYLRTKKGGNLLADCGMGKSIVGVEIALRLQRHTCVLAHKEFLVRQWRDNLRKVAPDISIGILQRDTCEYGYDYDVTIAMVQSITSPKREYPKEFYDSFGLLICDEVHRYGAEVWHEAIKKFPALYRLGLTATFRRGDGMIGVITSHIGGIAHTHEASSMRPVVYMRRVSTYLPESAYKFGWNESSKLDKRERAKLISSLAKMDDRSEVITRQVIRALKAGRKVFLLSERLGHLDLIAEQCQARDILDQDIGFFVGGKSEEELEIASSKRLILATWQMAREALDIPELDTLFMATPVSDIQQGVGRILRPKPGKRQPVVVDFVDIGIGPCVGMSVNRRKMYQQLGYEINW
jgi:superfamily II DNA or RNA helicase